MASSKVMSSSSSTSDPNKKTVDDVWREIVAGRRPKTECHDDQMMTLEDFLLKAGAADPDPPEVKLEPQRISSGAFGMALSGGGRGRGRRALEMDTAAEQRHRRMIKNRESAARSRERKQAYQSELESLAVKLEEENERLLTEKAAHTKERLKQLMERVVPVIEKRKPPRFLKRTRSMQW